MVVSFDKVSGRFTVLLRRWCGGEEKAAWESSLREPRGGWTASDEAVCSASSSVGCWGDRPRPNHYTIQSPYGPHFSGRPLLSQEKLPARREREEEREVKIMYLREWQWMQVSGNEGNQINSLCFVLELLQEMQELETFPTHKYTIRITWTEIM